MTLLDFGEQCVLISPFKQKEQQGKKWALRNIKLRISRKLIYVKGLLMCISCYNNDGLEIADVQEHLKNMAMIKPLDLLLKVCLENNVEENDLVDLLSAYDAFLGILNDSQKRDTLTNLEMVKAYENEFSM